MNSLIPIFSHASNFLAPPPRRRHLSSPPPFKLAAAGPVLADRCWSCSSAPTRLCAAVTVPYHRRRLRVLLSSLSYTNGEFVEAVIMRYDTRLGKYDGKPHLGGPRLTCVYRPRCKMVCSFCASGSMRFKNNLSSGDIMEQLVHASHILAIHNGMGEPLNNYITVVGAIRAMRTLPFQLSPKKITL